MSMIDSTRWRTSLGKTTGASSTAVAAMFVRRSDLKWSMWTTKQTMPRHRHIHHWMVCKGWNCRRISNQFRLVVARRGATIVSVADSLIDQYQSMFQRSRRCFSSYSLVLLFFVLYLFLIILMIIYRKKNVASLHSTLVVFSSETVRCQIEFETMGTTGRDLSGSCRTSSRELERSRRVSTKDLHDHPNEDSSRTSCWFNPIGTNSLLSKWTRSLWITSTVSCLDSQSLLDCHRRRETS